ncbi:YcaO-like family protein [Amycolatopsis minnesotensis]|uniref:YcaO-like family protein n=1 Tax=Amycolatopsis minnesotensis TaxID=337894 RepID=UPI0031DB5714
MTREERPVVQAGERGLPFAIAVERGLAALAELGIDAELHDLGGEPGACRCVVSRDGRWLANGCGKGNRDAARAGAVFEALEHHLSGRTSVRAETVELCSAHEVAAGALRGDSVASALADADDGPMGCRRYRSLTDGSTVPVPVFLSCIDYPTEECEELRRELGDTYDYTTAVRYSVNSGCASGASVTEATVHALNEIIERDAWSMMLVDVFLARRPRFGVLDPASLPDDLAGLLRYAEELAGDQVALIDMTTDLGVPSVMAYLAPEPGEAAVYFGCGTSLSRRHAALRALTELLQVKALETELGAPTHDRDHLRSYPPFSAASHMDLSEALRQAPRVAYADTPAPETPAEHLDLLRQALAARDFHGYVHELHVAGNGAAVISALVPGLERFMIVHLGSLVVPGPRGMAALRSGAS